MTLIASSLSRRVWLRRLGAASALAAGSAWLAGCQKPVQFHSLDVTGADYAQDFQLTDFNGQPRQLADFRGKVVVVFFGFTQCPDVCPTTMTEMAQVKALLGADGDKLQVLLVSIDPERDTPAVLREYMRAFDPSFLGLYASSPEALAALAKDFKVYYKKVQGPTPSSYSMDHTAASYVYDPQGRLRLYSRMGNPPQALAEDIRLLLQN